MAPTVPIDFVGQRESKTCSFVQMMGKSRKYSKGHASGFIPDYRHAVETMAESEGLGISGRVDTEMTASEDSCAPKRKCISLNTESYDCFGVPMQVLSLSMMSKSERKDLESRLKMELEQVRLLQKRVASLSSNVVAFSHCSDFRSCSDGQGRLPLENFRNKSGVLSSKSKKRAPGRNGARTKRTTTGNFEAVKKAVPAGTSDGMLMQQCETLLNRLMNQPQGYMFNTPVDVVKFNIPDYFTVIKHPMDLGTVKSKIATGEYSSPSEFAADVRLTFSNAMTYNPPGNHVHYMAEKLSKYFEVRWKATEKKISAMGAPLVPSRGSACAETEITAGALSSKNKKMTSNDNKVKLEQPSRQNMTDEEKNKLSAELEVLLGELPDHILNFLKEQSSGAMQTGEDEIEIDIFAFSQETLYKLRQLVDVYLLEKQKTQTKIEPCEMEIANESGFSNSSMPPGKGTDPADEDVDIVGLNDPPLSNCPSVEVEKDAAHRNSKISSSSSSSSESGSSSTDSGTSSGSESDTAKPLIPVSATKDIISTGTSPDRMIDGAGVHDVGVQSLNGLSQVELNSLDRLNAVEEDGHQEGESAQSERQVSPKKLYRAALLRSRFADTILKAREKALEKGEKRDPEKLRIEREELERRQREEKARLQAEAKAAEEARRKAEVEAAAEAKRQRELEREAARQALQKMEKTVDINENSQFMEDLEMLRTVNDDQLPSFVKETSPDDSENGFGSFKLQGSSNPLEQLGLYMKADDEEEEEEGEAPKSAPEPVNDIEEGKID